MIDLALLIDTSARPFNVVLGQDKECLFDSLIASEISDHQDLSAAVSDALHKVNRPLKDIQAIAVNVGPGALGSVRSGVSFANALAYSLGIAVYPVTSFEIMGFQASKNHRCPILCTARASNTDAYVGLYRDGALSFIDFGPLTKLVPKAVSGIQRVAVAGNRRSMLCAMLSHGQAIDSGLERSVAATILQLDYFFERIPKVFPEMAIPITEESKALWQPETVRRSRIEGNIR